MANAPYLLWQIDSKWSLWNGEVVQGDNLVITINRLKEGDELLVWEWASRTIPASTSGVVDYDSGTLIQGDSGTGTTGTVEWDITGDTPKALVTIPLPLETAQYGVGEVFSFAFKLGSTQGVQMIFEVTDQNPLGGGTLVNGLGFIDLPEITSTTNPSADFGRVLVRDDGGVTKLYFRDSVGTETDLLAAGSGDKTYSQSFSTTTSVSVTHNLGKYPAVSVSDSAGTVVYAEIDYIDSNNLTATFEFPFSGNIYCN